MIFQCSWDTTVISITLITTAILLAVIIALFVKMIRYRKEKRNVPALFCLLGVLLFISADIVSALFCPQKVSIENEAIRIHRIKGDIVIPVEKIEEIRLCNDSDTKNSKRTFGSGGAWGYLGKFNNRQLGNYQMYVTDLSKKILVKTTDENLIFSCDKPDEMVSRIQKMRNA
jgi:hypothetical protein